MTLWNWVIWLVEKNVAFWYTSLGPRDVHFHLHPSSLGQHCSFSVIFQRTSPNSGHHFYNILSSWWVYWCDQCIYYIVSFMCRMFRCSVISIMFYHILSDCPLITKNSKCYPVFSLLFKLMLSVPVLWHFEFNYFQTSKLVLGLSRFSGLEETKEKFNVSHTVL